MVGLGELHVGHVGKNQVACDKGDKIRRGRGEAVDLSCHNTRTEKSERRID